MKNMLWYNSLNKPVLTPPDWVFAPVWSGLYILMTISLILVVIAPNTRSKRLALTIFFLQLLLNLIWTPVFFGAQRIGFAGIICSILLILVVINIRLFYKISKLAAYLLIPYFLWMFMATYLNIEFIRLNPWQNKGGRLLRNRPPFIKNPSIFPNTCQFPIEKRKFWKNPTLFV